MDGGDGFQRHVTAGDRPLVVLLQHQRPDEEACIQSVSTRSVGDLVKAMGMTGISKSQISRLYGNINERVDTFLDRPLEAEWHYLNELS